jgi:hypothetical protein
MARQIARLLKTDMSVSGDLQEIARMLQGKGRGKDTILAHITPKEAEILKARGGRGSRNPETGLLEFDDNVEVTPVSDQPQMAPVDQAPAPAPAPEVAAQPSAATYPTSATNYADLASSAPEQAGYVAAPTDASPAALAAYGYTPPYANVGAVSPIPGAQVPPTQLPPEADLQSQGVTTPQQNALQKLLSGVSTDQLTRLGLAGGLGLIGANRAKKASQAAQAATTQQQQIAAPYQAQGQGMIAAAQAGQLTPQSQQAYQALQAQLNQGIANRGGVGVEQAAGQLEAFRQNLLQNQYNYGIQVAQIGDNIAIGAIRTGLQQDQLVNQATQNFYSNLAMIAAGISPGRTQ